MASMRAAWERSSSGSSYEGSMNTREMIRLVQEQSGEQDVELLRIPPAEIRYDEEVLHPLRVIRRGSRYLIEAVEYPGEWWMGEVRGDTIFVWGSYGSLDEIAAQH